MKSKRGLVSQIGYCHDCHKEWEDYKNYNARKKAYEHAKKTGHKVSVDSTTSITYN